MVIIQTLVNIVPNLNPNMKTKITHKTPIAEVDDQTVKLKEELSYNILPATRAIELTDNRSAIQPHPHPHPPYPYYNPSLPPPLLPSSLQSYNSNNQYYPYYPYPNYNPSSYSQISSEKDKELVQPNLPQLINTDEPQNNNFKDKKVFNLFYQMITYNRMIPLKKKQNLSILSEVANEVEKLKVQKL
ncbi:hypothetical protein RclHR1_06890011 [Rhizophagus clarus]|uniref:Uncharacterized protein n=1 Tax=Rhizophagus clarus TaxID=94130 RepID=A0A2Z6SJQ1_9GLOM|nr:hypothetical protein RclHR1_06890011 [Rhizophagus clarus]